MFWWDEQNSREVAEKMLWDSELFAEMHNLIMRCKSEVSITLDYHPDVSLQFFTVHRLHTLAVMDEYQWFNLKYKDEPVMDLHSPEPDPYFPVEAKKPRLLAWIIKKLLELP
jgi:hypothetical protein